MNPRKIISSQQLIGEDIDGEDSDSSDVSVTDSDSDSENESRDQQMDTTNENEESINRIQDSNSDADEHVEEEEEEDEVIRAIKRECEKKPDHPPMITSDDFVVDICFHPQEDLLAVANVVGDVTLYRYTNEENTIVNTLELHTKACRDIEFSHDGKILFSTSKDKSIMLSNVESGQLIRFYDKSHEECIYCLHTIDEHLFATGDDGGTVKLWDLRQNDDKCIYKIKKNEDYISDIVSDATQKYMLCSSGDGSLTTIDLRNRKLIMISEEYDEDLTCLGLFRSETKLVAGSSKGKLYMYNWNEFGLHSDAFPGPKHSINDLIPITENIVVTACEDGNLRATHLFPHRHLGIVGQHDLSVENVDICNDGKFIGSTNGNDIRFWNIEYFETFEKVSHKHSKHQKRTELRHNLPSSKVKNVSDFFSDLS